jgi:hypothetical protein
MPNIYGKERPSKTKKKKYHKPTAKMLGAGLASAAGRLLGSRQQKIESAVSSITNQKKPKSEKY